VASRRRNALQGGRTGGGRRERRADRKRGDDAAAEQMDLQLDRHPHRLRVTTGFSPGSPWRREDVNVPRPSGGLQGRRRAQEVAAADDAQRDDHADQRDGGAGDERGAAALGRRRRTGGDRRSAAIPSAPPICCDVLISPDARSASDGCTPASAAIEIGTKEKLATPVILAAGVLKLPSLAGPAGDHIHGQVLVGAVVAGLASYLSVTWLTRYFETRTLIPFAIYSLLAGTICIIRFA
jgi:hypothetical protein